MPVRDIDEGATAVEYAVMVALIAVIIFGTVQLLGLAPGDVPGRAARGGTHTMKPATPRTVRGAAEHGAAAVEFGIILPVLIAIVFGIIEFGFAFNTQIALTQAAREGIRHEVLGTGEDAEAQAVKAFISLQGETANAALIESCADEVNARLRVESDYAFIFFPFGDLDLRGEAVMRCGG